MSKILDNTTGSPISIGDTGITVDNVTNYTIPTGDYSLWASSDDIITEVGAGNIVVNDGSNNLGISDGIDLLKGLQPQDVDTTTNGLISTLLDGATVRLAVDVKDANAVTSASNVGAGGVGVFKQKTGSNLEFKKINAGSNKIIITDDTGNDELDVDADQTKFNHDLLLNYVLAQHRIINDAGSSTTELLSASKILALIAAATNNLDIKDSVETVATSNITLSGEQTLNGFLTSTSRVGVTGQSTASENGIYTTAAGAWTRTTDADEDSEVTQGLSFFVGNTSSTKNGFQYIITTADPIVVDTTAISFTEIKRLEFGTSAGTATEGNDSRIPIQDENDALIGTDGTPSSSNKYVTNSDSRNSDSRAPNGSASGDLSGSYPNPTVNAGADSTAIHDNVSAEISVVTEKVSPVGADLLIIEDSAASNAKKRVQMSNIDHDILKNFLAAEHVDWAGSGAGTIHTDNYIENATHTGEVTGSGALTIDKTAISGKSLVTAASGDHIMVGDASDTDNLKKVTAQSIADLGAGGTDADAIHDNVASEISAITEKVTPVSGDFLIIEDSAASNAKKRVQVGNLPGGGGGGNQLFIFDPNLATVPVSPKPALKARNNHPILSFDDGTDEKCDFHGVMSKDYSNASFTIDIHWTAASATTGDVVWGVEIERLADGGTDIDTDSFDTQQTVTTTTSGTSGIIKISSITLTQTQADEITDADAFRMRISRIGSNGSDTMSGDAELLRILGRQ